MSGFYEAAMWDVVRDHLDQSIEASVEPAHKHAVRRELAAADTHVGALVEVLRTSPGATEPHARLSKALADAGSPEPGGVTEWLHTLARSVGGEEPS